MKKMVLFIFISLCLGAAFVPDKKDNKFFQDNFSFASVQLKKLLVEANKYDTLFPRTTDEKGNLKLTDKYEWTSGFFPGSLWYTYQATKDNLFKNEAIKWTEKLESLQNFTEHHDLGFMMYCSYGNAFRLTGNEKYKDILVQSAKSLSKRYSAKTGCIKSWNSFGSWDGNKNYSFPVIIDNMMNLELLFFASRTTGDPYYRNIATKHALNVMKNQIRPDYSCYHVVCYDSTTGEVLTKETAQGYANNSTWARGQAWGIYGFTMTYRETRDERFLITARRMADYFIDNKELPADKIPYWDFNANDLGYIPSSNSHAPETPAKYRDASAAAVVASALLELSTFLGKDGAKYRNAAVTILHSLSSPIYRAKVGENADFMIKHCVGSIAHKTEIDVPLVYADYYFLEALNRYKMMGGEKNVATGL